MSQQYDGGLITATPVVPSGPYLDSTAPGIWTLDQQLAYAKQGIWPTAGNVPSDAQFNYVTMLLHGDGTNGAQNNTFVDSGPNSVTMSRVNTPTQGSFSPYGSNWSNFFLNTIDSNRLTWSFNGSPVQTAVAGTNYTIEFWVFRLPVVNTYQCIFSTSNDRNNIFFDATNVEFRSNGGTQMFLINSNTYIPLNTWTHVALVCSGTTWTLYFNGTSYGTYSGASKTSFTSGTAQLGGRNDADGCGYLSNFRVSTVARYSGNFTPSTTPFISDASTAMLTCQSNRFIDTSANAQALTANGTMSVQRFNPFGASTAYSTSVISGSGYFNTNTTDAITFPGSSQFTLGTNDFTIECWVYINDTSNRKYIYAPGNDTASHYGGFGLEIWGQQLCMWASSTGSSWNMLECDTVGNRGNITIPVNAWTHVAAVRTGGNTFKSYVNGVLDRTFTNSGSIYNNTSQILNIGRTTYTGGYAYFNGYISNFRVVNGTAVYTAAFTPPTTPLTAITNTKVLALSTNAGIFDNAMMNDLTTVGNAQISTSVKKYGTGSMYFNGTDSWLTFTGAKIGAGNFTIEAWVYLPSLKDADVIFDNRATTSSATGLAFALTVTGAPYVYTNNAVLFTSTQLVSTSTWTHVALVRSGSTLTIYVGGVSGGTATSSANFSDTNNAIGVALSFTSTTKFSGYIDDLRITNGYARYTTTFTPPTAAFPDLGPN
jgi:hypothetical protein